MVFPSVILNITVEVLGDGIFTDVNNQYLILKLMETSGFVLAQG